MAADIVRRIRKLLELSRSSSDAEAALAAERAAQLMAQHELTEAEVRLVDNRPAETIAEDSFEKTKRRVAWRIAIQTAVAKRFGCELWFITCGRNKYRSNPSGSVEVKILGRESAVQTAIYTAAYLCNEVDRLCDEAWEREGEQARAAGQTAKAWKNGFRLGAAGTISRRLYELKREDVLQRTREREAVRAQAAEARGAEPAPSKLDALVLLDRDEREVEEVYARKTRGWKSASAIGSTRSRNGYSAGQGAGAGVSLGGGRAGLGAGMGRIGGGK